MKIKKCIGYTRVSTLCQADEGVSMAAQEGKIRAWATAHDYELVSIEVDAGISGGKASNRPGLQTALDLACEHKAALVVYSLSRMARSTKDALSISERLDEAGADLVSLSEQINTTSAAGKMVFRMLAVLAEFERDLVSERTKASLSHLKSKGKRYSKEIPYGFMMDTDGENLIKSIVEEVVIEKMLAMRNDGETLQSICNSLNDEGIPTRHMSQWRPKTVRAIIMRNIKAQEVAA